MQIPGATVRDLQERQERNTMTNNMLLNLIDSRVRILKIDGKETQGHIKSANDHMLMIDSSGTKRFLPWTAVVSVTVLPDADTAPDAPRTP